MFKIIGLIGLISLQGQAYSFDCNYNILTAHTETYSGKITQSINSSVDSIKEDLNFLIDNSEKDNITQEYKEENFESLMQRSLDLSPSNNFLESFIKNCEIIYESDKNDTKVRQSVHMLVYEVTESLKEYFDDMELRQSFLNKKKLQQSSPNKNFQAADPIDNQGNIITENPRIKKVEAYYAPAKVH
ncbi:hypothetical protein [Candidatus Odyssella acanthamoebae]|uniref:Uncharacterized protein n=1 Tax=Candidatus Odyssella acanthamoebae TaxID=91604 RepID=A0A077AYQ6_9PROT|nr:hypothetical protein [Candidatus Paracaedibacter acanthamoebae]AIK95850.1 hypothetical protein ID47_02505 [Candidatus Paracaedibacter acanthamoebae]